MPDPPPKPEWGEFFDSVRTPLSDRIEGIEYNDTGEVDFSVDNLQVRYTYSPAVTLPPPHPLERREVGDLSEWRDLIDFRMRNTDTGEEEGINALRPPDCRITFKVAGRSYGEYATGFRDDKTVVMGRGLQSLDSLVSLPHEVAHINDSILRPELFPKRESAVERFKGALPLSKNHARTLKIEQYAWEVALAWLGPFMSEDGALNQRNVTDLVEGCLETYYRRIRQEQGLRRLTQSAKLGGSAIGYFVLKR